VSLEGSIQHEDSWNQSLEISIKQQIEKLKLIGFGTSPHPSGIHLVCDTCDTSLCGCAWKKPRDLARLNWRLG
jgi:hypothetical protein